MNKKLVSIVVPTYNCELILKDCLDSIKKQTYRPLEVIIVDSFSTDGTAKLAKKYGEVYSYGKDPSQKNVFAVPYQRNYGVSKAKGFYVYIVDSDMRLNPKTVETSVKLLESEKADAVILPEESYGIGFWAKCRSLEKACYNKSPLSLTDAARFVKKSVWNSLKGLDATLGGGDDWDFQLRLNEGGYKTIKSPLKIKHFEGRLTLWKQLKKKYIYGKNVLDYFKKHKDRKVLLLKQYSLIRPDFIQNYDLLLKQPHVAIGMFFMKTLEYTAAFLGMMTTFLKPTKVKIKKQ